MKKVCTYLVLILAAVIYYCSNNSSIIEYYSEYRIGKPFISPGHRGLGDLYNMCFISDYNTNIEYRLPIINSKRRDTDLYVICDSYLMSHLEKENITNIDSLVKIKWWDESSYITTKGLNKNKRNVLVIEMSERFIRGNCNNYSTLTMPIKFDINFKSNSTSKTQIEDEKSFLEKHFFNPNINSNLEMNLFDYKLFYPLKEIKGDINYHWFNRIADDLYIDKENHFLFYKPTMQGEQNMNSFYSIDSSEINNIKNTLNRAFEYYCQNGFEEIYFSIVPNPVSVVNPGLGKYNNLIPLLMHGDQLKCKKIDAYELFRSNAKSYYLNSDTHWNNDGLNLWVKTLNDSLVK